MNIKVLHRMQVQRKEHVGRVSESHYSDDYTCSIFHLYEYKRIIILIKEFNLMTSYDTQNAHLRRFITVNPVMRRAPKKNPDEAS